MLTQMLNQYYGITPDSQFNIGANHVFMEGQQLYMFMQITDLSEELLIELYEISEQIAKFGDEKVFRFVLSNEEKYIVTYEEKEFLLLSAQNPDDEYSLASGIELANFHMRGSQLQFKSEELNQLGMWKNYWVNRLDQLEKKWFAVNQKSPENHFEQLFMESFPYYLGLTENAIQYIVDTELDVELNMYDSGVISYSRFNQQVWEDWAGLKNPFDWVYDHPSRDIAEWIRAHYWENKRVYKGGAEQFLSEYQSIRPLSLFSIRFIFARLLFPLHYFQCIENYFLSPKDEYALELYTYIRDTAEYEHFLAGFFELLQIPQQYTVIPEWIR